MSSLVFIPWDEQRHRDLDWCEDPQCRWGLAGLDDFNEKSKVSTWEVKIIIIIGVILFCVCACV